MCRWLLSEVVKRSMSLCYTDMTYHTITYLYKQLQLLYFSLYSHAIDYRKNIIQFLYKSCHSQLPYLYDRSRTSSTSPLPSVAIILSTGQTQSLLSPVSLDPQTNLQYAKFSCFLLEAILRGHPSETNEIFSSLSLRIHSSFSSLYERHSIQEKRGYCQLPQPFVLHRLLRCLLSSNSSLSALATIQKLLNFIPYQQSEKSFLYHFFSSETFRLTANDISYSYDTYKCSNFHDSFYSLPSIGILLAGYMLQHLLHDYITPNSRSTKDIVALLTWVEKQLSISQNDIRSFLYSLDVLCTFRPEL